MKRSIRFCKISFILLVSLVEYFKATVFKLYLLSDPNFHLRRLGDPPVEDVVAKRRSLWVDGILFLFEKYMIKGAWLKNIVIY